LGHDGGARSGAGPAQLQHLVGVWDVMYEDGHSGTFTAKLVEGALKGAGDVKLGDMPIAPTPFTATKPK
jgi:hypothetical protein